ncbi:MAG: SurA N-terminal domain-containing protein [Candidatus Omnitrophica bacterium]|nr:SurA N-terminal domain-containing protein [Candidatus Omnitrophota bacterium]
MLKKLRHKKTSKRILIFLAAVIVPAFAFWGFSSVLHGPQEQANIGKIFGRSISPLEFKEAINAVTNMAIMRYGDDYTKIRSSLNLEAEAWQRLILLSEAKRKNIKVSDKEVVEYIESYPFFQNKGQFDNRIYNEMLQYVFRTLPRDFEEQTRQNLMMSRLYRQVTQNLKLTDQEIKDEYKKTNEEINLSYIQANPQDFVKDIPVDDQAILGYFQKNQYLFKRPLSFNIEYVAFNKDDPATNEKLKNLLTALKRKDDFTKTAKDFGLSLKETGLFAENDPLPGIGWLPQISAVLAKSNAGKYIEPVEVDKSIYVLRVKERKEPFIPDFESAKDKVKETFLKEESKKIAQEKINSALEKLNSLPGKKAKPADFEQTAKLLGLKTATTGFFKFGSYIEGIGASDSFFTPAQNLKDGEFSQIINMPSGFFIVKVKETKPIDEKKFAVEKDSFKEKLLLQKKQEYFTKFLEELLKKSQKS